MPARLRISATETVIESDAAADAALAAEFRSQNAIVLRDIFEPEVAQTVEQTWTSGQFVHQDVRHGARLLEQPPLASQMLGLLLSRTAMRAWLERITGVAPLGWARGAVVQAQAGQERHRLSWHNDFGETAGRMLGVTVNLGHEPYRGGWFEMRRRDSKETALRHKHAEPAAALIFRIDRDLLHRVTPLKTGGPRVVFTGWYYSDTPAPP